MTPIQGISTLVALYIGISGGLISAILLNIPGTPSSVATCFDGSPMAKKGEAGKALGAGIVFSFLRTMLGVGVLVISPPAGGVIQFGAYEYCALSVFSLSMVIALSGRDLTKGLISAVLRSGLGHGGARPIDSKARYTFGFIELTAGFKLLVFLIGIFAITEVIRFAEEVRRHPLRHRGGRQSQGFGFSFREFRSQFFSMIRSSLIGIGIGILPGIRGGLLHAL